MYAYVGSRTTRERHARGDGISVFRIDPATGGLTPTQVLGDLVNPSFLALDGSGERLYCVHGDHSDVSAFRVDRASGRLTLLNRQSTGGANPVHLALAPDGRHVVVSNHLGSSLAVLPLDHDGALGPLTQLVALDGPRGPHRTEQTQSKPHFNLFDPSGRYVLVPDKGVDRTFVFRFGAGRLAPAAVPYVAAREGAGPRHCVFHPRLERLYVLNELDSTVTSYRYAPGSGELQPLQVVTTLPPDFTGNSRAAEIAADAAGRRLYASNRGHDSIAVFDIGQGDGLLSPTAWQDSGGATPRFFALSPDGRLLYALNEDSDSIVAFVIDDATGRLNPTGFSAACGSPVCMVFSPGG